MYNVCNSLTSQQSQIGDMPLKSINREGTFRDGKFAGISLLNAKGTILKNLVLFLVYFGLGNIASD